jgi:hypothetical protein
MQTPPTPLRANRTVLALTFNGIVLLLILLVMIARNDRGLGPAAALGQSGLPMPAVSSGGLMVMPAQLSLNKWGCYVMDSQNQTLSVYEYAPGDRELRLSAARSIHYDRQLEDFNTTPSPADIKKMIERADEPSRAAPTTERSPEGGQQ